MVEARMKRRRLELMQQAAVIAYATNEPKKLEKVMDRIAPVPRQRRSTAAEDDIALALPEGESADFVKRWWDDSEPLDGE